MAETTKAKTPKTVKERKQLSLAEKLNQAIADIGPVKKDGENSYQNYRFQSEAAIKHAVKKVIAENGFDIVPKYQVLGQRDVKGAKGRINHIVDVIGEFTITDGRDDQKIVGTMPGSGMDTGEKAMAKACTSAQKYFYKQLFNISDQEEDPDATNSDIGATTNQPQRPQNNQRRNYQRPQSQANTVSQARKEAFNEVINKIASVLNSNPKEVHDSIIEMAKKEPNWAKAKTTDDQLAICINKANETLAEAQKPVR